MFICSKCKKEYSTPVQFCGDCGGAVVEHVYYCTSCLQRSCGSNKFCNSCGGKIEFIDIQSYQELYTEYQRVKWQKDNITLTQAYNAIEGMPRTCVTKLDVDRASRTVRVECKGNPEAIKPLHVAGVTFQLGVFAEDKIGINPQSVRCYSLGTTAGTFYIISCFVIALLTLLTVLTLNLAGLLIGGLAGLGLIIAYIISNQNEKKQANAKLQEWLALCKSMLDTMK